MRRHVPGLGAFLNSESQVLPIPTQAGMLTLNNGSKVMERADILIEGRDLLPHTEPSHLSSTFPL